MSIVRAENVPVHPHQANALRRSMERNELNMHHKIQEITEQQELLEPQRLSLEAAQESLHAQRLSLETALQEQQQELHKLDPQAFGPSRSSSSSSSSSPGSSSSSSNGPSALRIDLPPLALGLASLCDVAASSSPLSAFASASPSAAPNASPAAPFPSSKRGTPRHHVLQTEEDLARREADRKYRKHMMLSEEDLHIPLLPPKAAKRSKSENKSESFRKLGGNPYYMIVDRNGDQQCSKVWSYLVDKSGDVWVEMRNVVTGAQWWWENREKLNNPGKQEGVYVMTKIDPVWVPLEEVPEALLEQVSAEALSHEIISLQQYSALGKKFEEGDLSIVVSAVVTPLSLDRKFSLIKASPFYKLTFEDKSRGVQGLVLPHNFSQRLWPAKAVTKLSVKDHIKQKYGSLLLMAYTHATFDPASQAELAHSIEAAKAKVDASSSSSSVVSPALSAVSSE